MTIGFTGPKGEQWNNHAFFTGRGAEYYRNDALLLEDLARIRAPEGFLVSLTHPETVSGIIALLFILAIVWLVYQNPTDPKIPDILSSGLALILGFYFGKQSKIELRELASWRFAR